MRKIIYILLSFTLVACGNSGSKEPIVVSRKRNPIFNSKPSSKGPIVFFGDEIAKGSGYDDPTYFWKQCLKTHTDRIIVNKGVDELTTQSALKLVKNLSDLQPSAIILSIGINDIIEDIDHDSFPAGSSYKNLRTLYSKLKKIGALIVHLGIAPPYKNSFRLQKFGSIAQEHGILYVNRSLDGLWDTDHLSDSFPPNNEGYIIMCRNLVSNMRRHYNF